MDPATGTVWPRLPRGGGSGFQPRPAIHAPRADQAVFTVPPNSPAGSSTTLLPPEPLPVEQVILQLDGLSNSAYQTEEGQETEVVRNGPDEQGAGLDPEPVSNESFLSYRNFLFITNNMGRISGNKLIL